MTTLFIIAAGVAAACLAAAVAMQFMGTDDDAVSDRLDALAGKSKNNLKTAAAEAGSLFESAFDEAPGAIEKALAGFFDIRLLIEQADVEMTVQKFALMSIGLLVGGTLIPALAGLPFVLCPLVGLLLLPLPYMYLLFMRKRRWGAFGRQLPEALELMARGLRAGHSLQASFQLVGEEAADPLGSEFMRVFEEQNLGITIEDAMSSLTDRIPNLDLKFFATSVVLQRQTGGDLAEILDKIGHLVRERFKIYGQIQALTGEGRLSGIVLLAMPPGLLLLMFRLNKEYIMLLFTDPLGQKMLAATVVLQLIGAFVIKKIIDIKV